VPAVAIVVALTALYTVLGAVLAFNLWGAAERAAGYFARKPPSLWTRFYWRHKPDSWKAGGAVMLAAGVTVLVWIALQAASR